MKGKFLYFGITSTVIVVISILLVKNIKTQNSIEDEWITYDVQSMGLHAGKSVTLKFKDGVLKTTVMLGGGPIKEEDVKYLIKDNVLHLLSDTTYNHVNDIYYTYTVQGDILILTGTSNSTKGEKLYLERK